MSLASRVRETTTVVGTGDVTLLGAVAGYTAFSASYTSGLWVPYLIQSADGSQHEEGIAPISGSSTIQRSLGRVLSSSAAGARVNFAAGTKIIEGFVQDHQVATRLAAEKTAAAGGGGGSGSGGDASAANQAVGNASLAAIDADIGAPASAAAAADGTGDYGVISALKRGLLNWASLLTRIPALLNGRVPTEPLGAPGVSRQVSATNASTNTVLTVGVGRVSVHCRGANARYIVGSTSQTANATTSHWIADGERLDFDVPATPNIAFIRDSAATVNATIEISELS